MEDSREILASLRPPIGDNPCPIGMALEENQMEEALPTNLTHPITSVFPHPDQMATTFHESGTA